MFCVLPPVSVMYRHVITFLKCIHYFSSSKKAHYFSHRVQGNLHGTHVIVYTIQHIFKVYAIYSLDFIINGLVIWSLFHHLIALSLDPFERHCTTVNRILNSDSGLIVIPHFVPGLYIAPSPFFSHHRGSKAFIKYGFVWGFFCWDGGGGCLGIFFRRHKLLFWFCRVPDRARELVEAYRHKSLLFSVSTFFHRLFLLG